MMAPDGSNGDEGPTSTTKPLSFSVLVHLTVVPTFTQNSAFALALGMPGVEEAELEVLFTSTAHGVEASRTCRPPCTVAPVVARSKHACCSLTLRLHSPMTRAKSTRSPNLQVSRMAEMS